MAREGTLRNVGSGCQPTRAALVSWTHLYTDHHNYLYYYYALNIPTQVACHLRTFKRIQTEEPKMKEISTSSQDQPSLGSPIGSNEQPTYSNQKNF